MQDSKFHPQIIDLSVRSIFGGFVCVCNTSQPLNRGLYVGASTELGTLEMLGNIFLDIL